ncbi:MAG: (Fe-S)-binding protein [Bacteroidetes bacterium]|nr:(Fe-S)-binding protein [Bacteroidota bacterium]
MSSTEVGRDTLIGMPPWAIVLFYVLTAAAIGIFAWGAWRLIRKYRQGRRDLRHRPGPAKLVSTAFRVLGNVTVLRDDLYAGIAHLFVLSGFLVLFVGTLIVLVDRDILRFVLPSWVFWKGDFYLGFSTFMDIFGLVLLAGLLMLAVRRAFFRLPQLDYRHRFREEKSRRSMTAGDWVFLGLIFFIVFGGYALEAVRLVAVRPEFEVWSPVGWWASDLLRAADMDAGDASSWYPLFWWAHSLASLAFVAYVPWSKAVHMLLGYFSLAWQDETLNAQLPRALENDAAGYVSFKDMTWVELLALDACIRCGRCQSRCPSSVAGLPLSPRDVILELRDAAGRNGNGTGKLAGDVIPQETLWSCISCYNCGTHCPVGVNHVPLMVQLRRALVSEGAVDEQLQQTLINLQRCGNAMGQSDRMRAKWTQPLPFTIRDARKEEVEYLWFVGDNASYDPRVQEYTRTVAKLFDAAGLDFGILYEAERNAGNDVRRVGEEGLFEMLAEKNIRAFEKSRFRAIVTTDPHSYNTLKNEYPALGAEYPVFHYTEVLQSLIEQGRLLPVRRLGARVTYQDPCYLARYNGIERAPRELLEYAGVDVVEMKRRGRDAWCCGAGGGRLWMEDIPTKDERPAEQRIREAAGLGVDTLVTACPKDIVMFSDAIKNVGMEGGFFVRDVAYYVWESIEQPIPEHLEKEA